MAMRVSKRLKTIGLTFAIVAILGAAAFYGVWQLSRSRTFQLFGEIIPRVETTEKVVALTFDDGPTPEYAPVLIDTLKQHKAVATFFVVGSAAERQPDILKSLLAAGHDLANHSWSHKRMVLVSETEAAQEVERTDAVIRAAGYTSRINFRPANSKKLWSLPLYLAKHDRKTIAQDVEPDSDTRIAASADLIVEDVLARVKPGSIILLHPWYRTGEPTRQALSRLIDGLHARGYRFVTVTELLAIRDAAKR